MNNSDLRIILLIINWEQKTKYQQTISAMRKSRNVKQSRNPVFRKPRILICPSVKIVDFHCILGFEID